MLLCINYPTEEVERAFKEDMLLWSYECVQWLWLPPEHAVKYLVKLFIDLGREVQRYSQGCRGRLLTGRPLCTDRHHWYTSSVCPPTLSTATGHQHIHDVTGHENMQTCIVLYKFNFYFLYPQGRNIYIQNSSSDISASLGTNRVLLKRWMHNWCWPCVLGLKWNNKDTLSHFYVLRLFKPNKSTLFTVYLYFLPCLFYKYASIFVISKN